MTAEQQAVWDAFFGEIVGWTLHPGYCRDAGRDRPSLEECAVKCDEMVALRQKRIDERKL